MLRIARIELSVLLSLFDGVPAVTAVATVMMPVINNAQSFGSMLYPYSITFKILSFDAMILTRIGRGNTIQPFDASPGCLAESP